MYERRRWTAVLWPWSGIVLKAMLVVRSHMTILRVILREAMAGA